MKTIKMDLEFVYRPKRNVHVVYRAGVKYDRVPEAAVRAILAAHKGRIVVNERSQS